MKGRAPHPFRRFKMMKQTRESKKIIIAAVASILLSVKNTIIQCQARLFPLKRATLGLCLLLLLLVSCASGPSGLTRHSGNLWNDRECPWIPKWRHADLSSINGKSPFDYYVKGSPGTQIGYQIPVGLNKIEAKVLWSNQFMDYIELPLDVKEGRSYVVFSYELEQGQDPNTVIPCVAPPPTGGEPIYAPLFGRDGKSWADIIVTRSGNESVGKIIAKYSAGFLVGMIEVTVAQALGPILIPTYIIEEIYKGQKRKRASAASQDKAASTEILPTDSSLDSPIQPPDSTVDDGTKAEDNTVAPASQPAEPPSDPTARPFDGCCYVWIEDFETKEVVAGTRPSGLNK
jgi:hypothetical protein